MRVVSHLIKLVIIWVCVGGLVAKGQDIRVIRFEELQKFYSQPTDTIYVVNFWATWCRPCVAELPNFERLYRQYQNKKIKIVLVSMDFAKDLASKVRPFVSKKQLKAPIVLLNETDTNRFIDQVDNSWSGAIPATLIVNNARRKRKFFEKELTYDVLVKEIDGFL